MNVLILVVDDEPHILALVTRALHADGHETVVAEDGQAALDRALEGDIDLVILDIMMPGESGLELTSWVRNKALVRAMRSESATSRCSVEATVAIAGLACGRMIRRSAVRGPMPIVCAASHCPLGTDRIAERMISAA